MQITQKLTRPVREANYLNVENTGRYRSIIRLFYISYERLKYWLYPEEVYQELCEDPYFSGYTQEQCNQDLTALVSWGNLLTLQDTRKVTSIDEFKNKKFRYQLSEYGVEIERMVVRLENLSVEGSSLEPTLLERLRALFEQLSTLDQMNDEKLYSWWNALKNDFMRLNQNYQDYMRTLNSAKAEELMQTKAFLVFKDRLLEYLRSFVKGLQQNVGPIELCLRSCSDESRERMLERITDYEFAIPRLDMDTITREQVFENIKGRFSSIYSWFTSENGIESEAGKVFDAANEIIRKITRYASRITEQVQYSMNRKEEYKKLSSLFSACTDLKEAHQLSALVFGMKQSLHFQGDFVRKTDSIHSGVYEEEPFVVQLQPRVRTYKEKVKRTQIQDHSREKELAKQAELQRIEEERKILESFIVNGRLCFANMPKLQPGIRDTFLVWLSNALEDPEGRAKTEDGRFYQLRERSSQRITLSCEDGDFIMPDYEFVFEEEPS